MFNRIVLVVVSCVIVCLSTADAHLRRATDRQICAETEVCPHTIRLENGLQIKFLRPTQASDTVEVRVIIGVGSNQESEGEENYAHLVEHLAFEGTDGFPGASLKEELAQVGIDFGNRLAGGAGENVTIYRVSVDRDMAFGPNDLARLIRGWIDGMTISDTAVAAQAEATLNEARPVVGSVLEHNRLIAQDMLGDTSAEKFGRQFETMRNVTSDKVRQFYRKWYRPDNASIIIAGAVDEAAWTDALISGLSTIAARKAAPASTSPATFDVETSDVISVLPFPDAEPAFRLYSFAKPSLEAEAAGAENVILRAMLDRLLMLRMAALNAEAGIGGAALSLKPASLSLVGGRRLDGLFLLLPISSTNAEAEAGELGSAFKYLVAAPVSPKEFARTKHLVRAEFYNRLDSARNLVSAYEGLLDRGLVDPIPPSRPDLLAAIDDLELVTFQAYYSVKANETNPRRIFLSGDPRSISTFGAATRLSARFSASLLQPVIAVSDKQALETLIGPGRDLAPPEVALVRPGIFQSMLPNGIRLIMAPMRPVDSMGSVSVTFVDRRGNPRTVRDASRIVGSGLLVRTPELNSTDVKVFWEDHKLSAALSLGEWDARLELRVPSSEVSAAAQVARLILLKDKLLVDREPSWAASVSYAGHLTVQSSNYRSADVLSDFRPSAIIVAGAFEQNEMATLLNNYLGDLPRIVASNNRLRWPLLVQSSLKKGADPAADHASVKTVLSYRLSGIFDERDAYAAYILQRLAVDTLSATLRDKMGVYFQNGGTRFTGSGATAERTLELYYWFVSTSSQQSSLAKEASRIFDDVLISEIDDKRFASARIAVKTQMAEIHRNPILVSEWLADAYSQSRALDQIETGPELADKIGKMDVNRVRRRIIEGSVIEENILPTQ